MNFTKLSFATWMLVIAASCFASQDSVKVVKGQVSMLLKFEEEPK